MRRAPSICARWTNSVFGIPPQVFEFIGDRGQSARSSRKPQTLQSVRDQFPGTQRWSYFDVAARGLLPRPSREAVDRYLDSLMFDGGDKAQMFAIVESREPDLPL